MIWFPVIFTLLWWSGSKPQYLWSMSINSQMTVMVSLLTIRHLYKVNTILLVMFPRLYITPLWLIYFRTESLCSWLLVPLPPFASQTSFPLKSTNLFLPVRVSVFSFFAFYLSVKSCDTSVFLWFTLPSAIHSRFIHVVTKGRFYFYGEYSTVYVCTHTIYSIVCMCL